MRIDGNGTAVLSTVDFFTPVVDDAYDWGRIAAANAFSDIYAMGGRPILAVNLVCWPRDLLPMSSRRRSCAVASRLPSRPGVPLQEATVLMTRSRNTAWRSPGLRMRIVCCAPMPGIAGLPLSLSKPLGIGVLNSRHKQTGEVFPQAVATMVALNRAASEAALESGVRCATDVTGFGLLGHLYKLARASNLTAIIDADAVPYLDGARDALDAGYVSGGTRRNLDWVAPHVAWAGRGANDERERLLLADAQTSGGLLDRWRDSRGAGHRRTGPAQRARHRGALTGGSPATPEVRAPGMPPSASTPQPQLPGDGTPRL